MSILAPAEATLVIALEESFLDSTPELERRSAVRYPCYEPGVCRTVPSWYEPYWNGIIKDISVDGIGLITDRRFEEGTILEIRVSSQTQDRVQHFIARVVRVVEHADQRWLVGCELITTEPNSEKWQAS